MADGPASTIVFDGDSTGAVAALHAVDVAAKNTAASVKGTGAALGSIGDGADAGVNKAVAATSRFEAQLKRLNLELESGGRNTAAYIEGRAKLAGADTAALAPLIAQYDQLKAKQTLANSEFTKAGKVMTEYGMTVKGTAAALRQVPAQFTDIIVSLQGGQAPLTVLLQQGGQLKDVFGGVGNAAKALGGYILGLVNPFTVVAGTVGVVGLAAYRASEDVKALRTALIMAGTQSTTSLSSLDATAAGLNKLGVSTATSSEALVAFIGAGAKVDERLQDITKTSIDLEKFGGAAIAETAKKFVALAKDPLADFDRLTLATYSQIEALLEQGRRTEAVTLAQSAFNEANKETAKSLAAMEGPLDYSIRWWKELGVSVWDAAKGMATALALRSQTGDQERAELQKRRDLYAAQGYDTTKEDARLAIFKQIDDAQKKQNGNLSKELELKNLLAKFNEQDTSGKKQRELNQSITDYSKLLEAGQISVEQYTAAIKKLSEVKEAKTSKPVLSEAEKANAAAVKADIAGAKEMERLKTKFDGDEMKRIADLAEAKAKAFAKSAEAYSKELDARAIANADQEKSAYDYAQAVDEGIKRTEFEISLMGKTEQARAIALGQYEIELRLQKQILEVKKSIADESAKDQAIAGLNAAAIREKSAVANRVMVDEFKKTSDQINSTLTDALMRGFESGKGFARNLRDTVVNMFKTMVLRPIISAVMSPISGAITGAMGLSGAAQAGQAVSTGSSLLSAASMASSLAGIGSTIAGAVGTAIGSFTGGLVAANAATVTLLTGSAASAAAAATAAATAGGAAATAATAAATAGSTAAASLMAVAAPAAIAVAVLAAFGAFRTTKQTGTGISGTLGDDASLTGFNEMRKSGYLFGGPKYWDEIKAIDPLMAKALKADFTAIKAAATGAADALGLASTSVAGFNKAFRIEFTGDKAKDESLYKDLMAGVSEDLARTIIGSYKETITTVIDEITSGAGPWWDGDAGMVTGTVERQVKTTAYTPSEFAREGETASQTLTRLSQSITLVNGTSDMLGNKLTEVGLKGANTASLLIDAFGGAERYAAQMGAYYQNFYTQEEQRAKLIENTSEAFTALGKTMPVLDGGARAAYRSMVELAAGQDMSVESNRTAYASLLALQGPMNELAPTFDSVAQAAKDAALEQAAWQTRLDIATGITTQREVEKAAALLAADNATDLIILSLYAFEDAQTATAKATAKATEASRTALQLTVTNTQTSISSLVAMYGDLAGAVLEISQPTKTLVDQWRTTTTELTTLTQGLAQALGELPEATALDRLKATLATLASATNGIANISDQIFGLQVGRGDQAAVSLLQGREASLGAELATSNDPGAVAAKLATTMLQRIKLQGQLADKVTNDALKTQFDAATTMAQLEKTNRDKQITAIRDQISAAETLTGVVSSMRGYLAELRFGNLSALNPGDQLSAAQGNYATLLAGAQGGDTKAMQDLQGGASNYLQEAQGYYGGATSQYAGIFQAVTSGLEQFGATPVTDITLLKDQLTALEKIEAANLTLQTVVTDTTELQINGLNTINTTLTNRESEARQDAADNKKAVQDQIAELKAIVAGQEAQIKQQAAIYEGLMDRLTTATTALENIDRTTTTTAAAPV